MEYLPPPLLYIIPRTNIHTFLPLPPPPPSCPCSSSSSSSYSPALPTHLQPTTHLSLPPHRNTQTHNTKSLLVTYLLACSALLTSPETTHRAEPDPTLPSHPIPYPTSTHPSIHPSQKLHSLYNLILTSRTPSNLQSQTLGSSPALIAPPPRFTSYRAPPILALSPPPQSPRTTRTIPDRAHTQLPPAPQLPASSIAPHGGDRRRRRRRHHAAPALRSHLVLLPRRRHQRGRLSAAQSRWLGLSQALSRGESSFVPHSSPIAPMTTENTSLTRAFASQEKRYRSMQEHIRRAHPEHYISKLPATEESFQLMINTPPSERPQPAPQPQQQSLSSTGAFPLLNPATPTLSIPTSQS